MFLCCRLSNTCTLYTSIHTSTGFVQFSVRLIFLVSPRCICCQCDGVGVLVLGVSRDRLCQRSKPLSPSEVSSIICAQVFHTLSAASSQHPADRCYLHCYYPSSNKTTLLVLFQAVENSFPAEVSAFFFFHFFFELNTRHWLRLSQMEGKGFSSTFDLKGHI